MVMVDSFFSVPRSLSFVGGVFFLINSLSSQNLNKTYYGDSKKVAIYAQVKDSFAYVEYARLNMEKAWITKFDTLKLCGTKFIGHFSQIYVTPDNTLIFKPGKITLSLQEPDSLYNRKINLGYLQFTISKYQKYFTWTGAMPQALTTAKWRDGKVLFIDPRIYKTMLNNTYDSLFNCHTSGTYAKRFNKVVIKNYLLPKKYFESTDSVDISMIWQKLSSGIPQKRKFIRYLGQYPIAVLLPGIIPSSILDITFEYSFIIAPGVFLGLIYSEKFLGNIFSIPYTSKIIFSSTDKNKCKIKIRRSRIVITDDYKYTLPCKIL